MISVVKFFDNPVPSQRATISLISRTLCKLAFITKDYQGPMPKDSEFWWIHIQQETFARNRTGQSGCFVVEPIRKVNEKIMRLIPGMFTLEVAEGILLIRPLKNPNLPWIFPLNLRKKLAEKYKTHAVIVDLTPEEGFIGENLSMTRKAEPLPPVLPEPAPVKGETAKRVEAAEPKSQSCGACGGSGKTPTGGRCNTCGGDGSIVVRSFVRPNAA